MMGTPIPLKMRREMAEDAFYSLCARRGDHQCADVDGSPIFRLTWEHAMIHAGRKVQEIWAIIPLCPWSHLGPGLNKEINQWIALSRATDEELEQYPRTDWLKKRGYLVDKYGKYCGKGVHNVGISSVQKVENSPSYFNDRFIPNFSTGYAHDIPRKSGEENPLKMTSPKAHRRIQF